MDIRDMRRDYQAAPLDEADAPLQPLELFERWFSQATEAQVVDANAMVLSTVGADGRPSSRVVLVKGVDEQGLTFFTNHDSRKGQELAANPQAALLFHWRELDRVVRIEGRVAPVAAEESDEYFAVRPHASQVGAWASPQSRPIASREVLEDTERSFAEKFGEQVPRPPYWGGYRLVPEYWEFWQGRPGRLHDRLRYTAVDDGWQRDRLAP